MKSFLKKYRNRWAVTDRMFFSLFLTGMIIEFSQVGAGFIDGLVISRFLGPEAMAAEGIVHPIFSIFGIVSGLLAVGMQTRCAQAIGRGDRETYTRFASAAVYAGVIVSLICTVLLLAFAKPFTVLLGASGNAAELLQPASTYLKALSFGAPSLIMTAVLAPALQLDTGRKIIQTGAIIEAVSNILLDFAAVNLGWGIFGVGLATAIASYLNLLYQCTFFLKKDRVFHFVRPDVPFRDFVKMLTNGSEKAVRRLANTLRPIILNSVIISYGGTVAMSALSVRNNFSNFVEIYGAGIASAVALLTGIYYGEMNEEGIAEVNREEHRTILCFPFAVCVLMLIFAKQIAHLYIAEEGEIYSMALFTVRALALQLPLQALIESRVKYLQAIQKKHNMTVLTVATRFIFVILSAFVLGRLFGSYGILTCFTVSDALTLVAVYIYYAVKCRTVRPTEKDFLNLPDSFYLNPGDVISLDIRNMTDVSLGSEQIALFCKGHNADPQTTFYAALAFEELAENIVLHGFPNNRDPNPIIDLRVVITGDCLAIRMRDNCPQYDVTKQIAAANENSADGTHNFGIRIVSKIASDITYLHTFETNCLILRYNIKKRSDL